MNNPPHFHTSPQFVLTHEGELHGEDTQQNREIVRRIHACVQACEGISTEELEKGIVQDMRQVISQVAPLLEEKKSQSVPRPSISIPAPPPTIAAPQIPNG